MKPIERDICIVFTYKLLCEQTPKWNKKKGTHETNTHIHTHKTHFTHIKNEKKREKEVETETDKNLSVTNLKKMQRKITKRKMKKKN